MVLWIVFIVLIFGAGLGTTVMLVKKRSSADGEQLKHNLGVLEKEISDKQDTLRDLAGLSLGFVDKESFAALEEQHRATEEELRAERGRLTITEAELEAVDTRLRELEELKRELEMSSLDATRELELLRAQERDMAQQNEALKGQLQSALDQLDMLLDMVASSAEAVDRLNRAKSQLIEAEKKSSWYTEQTISINHKYIALKKAYDALDIEYAQLYEKQQSQ